MPYRKALRFDARTLSSTMLLLNEQGNTCL
jgi:hypothetical protein